MKLCKFCPDCRTYDEIKNGDIVYCPYCGSTLLKNYEEDIIHSINTIYPLMFRRLTNDKKVLKLYFESNLYSESGNQKNASKKAKKNRFW